METPFIESPLVRDALSTLNDISNFLYKWWMKPFVILFCKFAPAQLAGSMGGSGGMSIDPTLAEQ